MKAQKSFSNSQRRRHLQRGKSKLVHRRSDLFVQQIMCDKKDV